MCPLSKLVCLLPCKANAYRGAINHAKWMLNGQPDCFENWVNFIVPKHQNETQIKLISDIISDKKIKLLRTLYSKRLSKLVASIKPTKSKESEDQEDGGRKKQ